MSTEINTNNMPLNIANSNTSKSAKASTQATESNSQTKVPVTDTVSITDKVSRLQEIEDHLAAIPVINVEKVAEIKQAISDGTFKIDPESVAAKLVEFETSNIN